MPEIDHQRSSPGTAAYGAAKAGLLNLTQSLAQEWGPQGIRVNAIIAGLIERHHAETGSQIAGRILANWEAERGNFLQICPKEMLPHLAYPLSDEAAKVPAE